MYGNADECINVFHVTEYMISSTSVAHIFVGKKKDVDLFPEIDSTKMFIGNQQKIYTTLSFLKLFYYSSIYNVHFKLVSIY